MKDIRISFILWAGEWDGGGGPAAGSARRGLGRAIGRDVTRTRGWRVRTLWAVIGWIWGGQFGGAGEEQDCRIPQRIAGRVRNRPAVAAVGVVRPGEVTVSSDRPKLIEKENPRPEPARVARHIKLLCAGGCLEAVFLRGSWVFLTVARPGISGPPAGKWGLGAEMDRHSCNKGDPIWPRSQGLEPRPERQRVQARHRLFPRSAVCTLGTRDQSMTCRRSHEASASLLGC